MYIPVTYWNNQLATRADLTVNYSAASPQNFTYVFDDVSLSGSVTKASVPVTVCQDVVNSTDIIKSNVYVAGTAFFCSAAPSTSVSTSYCTNYTFEYGGVGCTIGGAATAEYYDCGGNQQLFTVYYGDAPVTKCVSSVVNRSCVIETPLGTVCGSNTTYQPSQCCISSYPNTGVEAWYMDVTYGTNIGDKGPQYYNYIDINGNIVNDSIAFGETKRIISQCNPMAIGSYTNFYGMRILWTIVSKFPGQVLAYPFKGIPCDYTLTLKRDSGANPGTYFFPYITWQTLSDINGYPIITESSSFAASTPGTLGSSIVISSHMPPLDAGSNNNQYGSAIWITNVTPKPKGALLLSSCLTTHSLWVTLNDYSYYNTGSVLKVNNPELTTTSSCWTVTNVTSSVSTSVSLTNVDVSASYDVGYCLNCLGFANEVIATGGESGSFISGSNLYRYNKFSTNGTFNIVSGSITNGKLMVIAGGGGGGASAAGGAGGLIYSSSLSMNSGSYSVVVGTGGLPYTYTGTPWAVTATNGNNSSFIGGGYNVVAIGGGKGAEYTSATTTTNGGSGGSGGGGNFGGSAGLGTPGQGFDGGGAGTIGINNWSGGGGGAGGPGSTRYGGPGLQLGTAMFNSSSVFASGGGVQTGVSTTSGSGGQAGGGATNGQNGLDGLVVITYPAFY